MPSNGTCAISQRLNYFFFSLGDYFFYVLLPLIFLYFFLSTSLPIASALFLPLLPIASAFLLFLLPPPPFQKSCQQKQSTGKKLNSCQQCASNVTDNVASDKSLVIGVHFCFGLYTYHVCGDMDIEVAVDCRRVVRDCVGVDIDADEIR